MRHSIQSAWLEISSEDSVFYQLHKPNTELSSSTGIIIISPMGPEYMYCYRTIKCLSNKLASQGFYTLRYDPVGMGNSSSDLHDTNIVEKWIATPSKLSEHFLKACGLKDIIFIGLRSGCLILSELLKLEKARGAVYWYPYTNGKVWVRDLSLVDSMLNINSDDPALIDGGGYPLTSQAQDRISQVNLNQSSFKLLENILLIEDSKSLPNKKLAAILEDGQKLEKLALPGMKEMLQQATHSIVPQSNLDAITQWMEKYGGVIETQHQEYSDNFDYCYQSNHFVEKELVIPGDKQLFGIFSEPKNSNYESILILSNAGSGHHVGPNRLNTDIARQAAELNMASYRFDFGHLGESTHDNGERDNHPYLGTSAEDVVEVINFLSKCYQKNIILVGLCSAGHNFFHAALASDCKNLSQLIVINPLTFYYQKGNSIFSPQDSSLQIKGLYESKQALKQQSLSTIFSDKKIIINIIKYVVFYTMGILRNTLLRLLSKLGLSPRDQLDKDFFKLKEKNIQLVFLCSDTDPGYHVIRNQAPVFTSRYKSAIHLDISKMFDSDHTFSSAKSRQQLIKLLMKKLV
jgi:hypothetical protein